MCGNSYFNFTILFIQEIKPILFLQYVHPPHPVHGYIDIIPTGAVVL